jgi:hypothetical protein
MTFRALEMKKFIFPHIKRRRRPKPVRRLLVLWAGGALECGDSCHPT